MAIRQVERVMHQLKEDVEFYYIDVKKDRPVSQKVAEITGVQHESPQILILKEGEVFWHASHHAIREDKLKVLLGERFPGGSREPPAGTLAEYLTPGNHRRNLAPGRGQ